jgi:uncharacterized membrane protein YqgA involved in biofilm formation
MTGLGTLINVAAVLAGGAIGLVLGGRIPERIRQTVMHGLGLLTIVIGVQLTFESRNSLVLLGSLLLGGIAGELLRIEERLDRLGLWLERRTTGKHERTLGDEATASPASSRFSRAFLTASLVFCVGPMAILGSIKDGLDGDITLLSIKSGLDLFAALGFASTLGVGTLFAALSVLAYQGLLTLAAGLASAVLTEPMVAQMTASGGVLLLALGIGLLGIKEIRTANLLPALVLAPLLLALTGGGA